MYHCSAAVALNTSGMIEAAIVGRPVLTILAPQFHHSQEGTIHFRYLLEGPHPLLRAARSLDAHALDLAAVLRESSPGEESSARFVESFVRPRGAGRSATDHFVDELETIAAQPAPRPVAAPAWAPLLRPLLWPFAGAATRRARRISTEFREHKARRLAEHRRRKTEAVGRAQHAPSRR
jgi:hypothetical protein